MRALAYIMLLALTTLAGCAYYSFTGASIPAHLRTVAVPLVEDNSISTLSTLGESLTELLIDRFVGQTRLSLEPAVAEADVVVTGIIDRYANEPTSVSGQEQATRNRVTITVTVRYADQVNQEELLQRSFTAFGEYDPVEEGLDGEVRAAAVALERIAEDVFTAATSNW